MGRPTGRKTIAQGVEGVTVIEARPLPKGWTGKANAVWTGAQQAKGEWLLFTDADTVHEPGDLIRAMHEADKAKVAMLSYSPRQIVTGFWQRALMPLVFCELALAYPPEKVSNPESTLAAANGQFILVQREAYFAAGRPCGDLRVGAGRCGAGAADQAAQGWASLSVCSRCAEHADVPQLWADV